MQKLFLFLTLAVSCITSYAQTNVHKNAREFRKMTEISSVVTLNNSQKSSINDALSRKEDKMERFNGKPLTKHRKMKETWERGRDCVVCEGVRCVLRMRTNGTGLVRNWCETGF
jgi:hypothetical protein